MPRRPVHTKIAELERENLADGALERCAVRSDDSLITVNWIKPGPAKPPYHSHPFDQLSVILEGAMEFDLDGELFLVSAGESLAIPAGVPHTGRVIGEQVALNIDVFAPFREDYAHLVGYSAGAFEDEDHAQSI